MMVWKARIPWLILSALWLESALFRPYLIAEVPLFPFFYSLPAFWAAWLPPLLAVWMMLALRRIFPKKSWLPIAMSLPPALYVVADAILFLMHANAQAPQLDLRLPAAFGVLVAFVLAVIPPATQKTRFRGSWLAVVATAGLMLSFWGNPYWGGAMALILGALALIRHYRPLSHPSPNSGGNPPPNNPTEGV
ncbi:MAG: hypothetical protein OWR62_09550 [Sulfobacillus thermotolerans]|nr:hypothetical protein [Sulfobacillus thermotolerans]